MPGGRIPIYENRRRRTFAVDGRNDKFLQIYAKSKGDISISLALNKLLGMLRKRHEEKTGTKIKSSKAKLSPSDEALLEEREAKKAKTAAKAQKTVKKAVKAKKEAPAPPAKKKPAKATKTVKAKTSKAKPAPVPVKAAPKTAKKKAKVKK